MKIYLGNFEFVENILKYLVVLDHIIFGLSIKIHLQKTDVSNARMITIFNKKIC